MKSSLLALLLVLFAVGCQDASKEQKYILPKGFTGTAITVYEQDSFPSLPIENGMVVHRYPVDGILFTSSSGQYGAWHRQKIEFEDTTDANIPTELKSSSGSIEREGVRMLYSLKVFGEGTHLEGVPPEEYKPALDKAFFRVQNRMGANQSQ